MRSLLAIIALAVLLLSACSSSSSKDAEQKVDTAATEPGGGQEASGTPSVDTVTGATPAAASLELGTSHVGFGKADCANCHAKAHTSSNRPGQCASCHGPNGAPARPLDHALAGCAGCHESSHGGLGFESPSDCAGCHGYAKSSDPCVRTETFDVVVIGAGGGGLGAAATLSLAGKDVVVLEQNHRVGGYMGRFTRGDYNFEISLHAMDGLDPAGLTTQVFKDTGILEKVKPVRAELMYRSIFPDLDVKVPGDPTAHRDLMKELFPAEAAGIDALWEDLWAFDDLLRALIAFQAGETEAFQKMLADDPGLTQRIDDLMNKSLSTIAGEHVSDERFFALWTQLAGFLGVQPSKLPAFLFYAMWTSYYIHGYYYFEGGSQSVADALAEVVAENGGRIDLHTKATGIVVEDGKAVEVRAHNGACYRGDYVVSNANAPATMLDMVGEEHLPEDYVTRLKTMTVGLPAVVVYLGVNKDYSADFDGVHEIMVNTSFDTDEVFSYVPECNDDMSAYAVANYSMVDPTAAPAGKNVLVIVSQLAYDCYEQWRLGNEYEPYQVLREGLAQKLIQRTSTLLPDIWEHIEVVDVATPRTLKGFTGNPKGTIFGWDSTIEQSMQKRLAQKTPVANLFLAGAWTLPGPGQSAVIMSGRDAARAILKEMK